MKMDTNRRLAKGQIWKTRAADIQIVGLGKRLIHYRVRKQWEPKRVSVQISGIKAMENYLKANEAQLANSNSSN